ncbi:hypothetical protein [Flaviflagellibacter deserti]|jgi:hypothetical protein|uniref:Flagellar protein FlaG n=1 Tax=Flaviflagellibacter deserti TaxID=2267266 RepID=A0ABV9Z4C2_9HYPH
MDAALQPRTAFAPAPTLPRVDVTPVPDAVRTELPQPDQSVAALAQSGAQDGANARPRAKNELPRDLLADETLRELERETEVDDEAKVVVTRTVDGTTGRVVNQFPAENILKLRAYVREEVARAEEEPIFIRSA